MRINAVGVIIYPTVGYTIRQPFLSIVQHRITKLLKSTLFVKLPAIRFHILTPFLGGKLVVLPPFRGAILPFEK